MITQTKRQPPKKPPIVGLDIYDGNEKERHQAIAEMLAAAFQPIKTLLSAIVIYA